MEQGTFLKAMLFTTIVRIKKEKAVLLLDNYPNIQVIASYSEVSVGI